MSKSTIRASKKPEKEIRQQHQQENEKESQRKVEICGDSMIKYIQAHKLGRSTNDRVTSKLFSGAKCKDMKHYNYYVHFRKETRRNHTAHWNKRPKDQQRKNDCQRYCATKRLCSETKK